MRRRRAQTGARPSHARPRGSTRGRAAAVGMNRYVLRVHTAHRAPPLPRSGDHGTAQRSASRFGSKFGCNGTTVDKSNVARCYRLVKRYRQAHQTAVFAAALHACIRLPETGPFLSTTVRPQLESIAGQHPESQHCTWRIRRDLRRFPEELKMNPVGQRAPASCPLDAPSHHHGMLLCCPRESSDFVFET